MAVSLMGDLTKALGMDAITIRAQVNDLLVAGKLRKEGERRGTRYFAGPGGGGRKKATKRKTAKKRATKKKTTKRATARKSA